MTMEINKAELIEMFKAGRSIEDLNAFIETVKALPEQQPAEQPPENSSEDANKIKQLEEQLATMQEQQTKLQADLAAAQQANTRRDAGEDSTDPMDAVRELFRRS